jgi:acetyl esterase
MQLPGLVRPLLRAAVRVGGLAEPLYGGPVELDGQRLDPDVHAALAAGRRAGTRRLEDLPVGEARAYAARMLGAFDAAPRPMARVIETSAPGPAGPIPIHVYEPHRARPAMIVFFHGGGGVIGSLASYDVVCRLVADRTRARVAAVAYRLAPEAPHPAAIDDAVAAWRWAGARAADLGVDRARIGVAGDSFGGYLAAWVERRARAERLGPPAVVGLVYPLVDLTLSSPSIDTFADGFLLTRSLMMYFRGHYLPDAAARPAASPIFFADADLAGAAPAVVVTAGFDPLRDEGRAYADRLAAAGARVRYRCETDQIHGFLGMTGAFRRADAAARRLCDDLAAELSR